MLHQIQIEFHNPEDARDILSLAEQYDDITAIEEKSFTGDVTTIELYIKVSSVKTNGEKFLGIGLYAKRKRTSFRMSLCWHYLFSRPVTRQLSSA